MMRAVAADGERAAEGLGGGVEVGVAVLRPVGDRHHANVESAD